MIAALNLANECPAPWYDEVRCSCRHTFSLVLDDGRKLTIAKQLLISRVDSEPAPCIRIFLANAIEHRNLLDRLNRTFAAESSVPIDGDIWGEFHTGATSSSRP